MAIHLEANDTKDLSSLVTVKKSNIPEELRDLPQWITWTPTLKSTDKGLIKVLKKPDLDNWTEPTTTCTFDHLRRTDQQGCGLRYNVQHPYVCVDLDNIGAAQAQEWTERLGSYIEVSPSGNGYHIIIKCSNKSALIEAIKGGKFSKNGNELFVASGYVTVTGVLPSWSECREIVELTAEEVLSRFVGGPSLPQLVIPNTGYGSHLSNTEALTAVEQRYLKGLSQKHGGTADRLKPLSEERVRELLRLLPIVPLKASTFKDLYQNDVVLDYDETEEAYIPWVTVGMALHHNFNGSATGFKLWDDWSKKGAKYDGEACISKWRSFEAKDNSVTISILVKLANKQRPKFPDLSPKKVPMPTINNLKTYLTFYNIEVYLDEIDKQCKARVPKQVLLRWDLEKISLDHDLTLSEISAYICSDLVSLGFGGSAYGETRVKKILTARSKALIVNPIRDYFQQQGKKWDGVDRLEALYQTIQPQETHKQYFSAYKQFIRKWLLQVIVAATQSSSGEGARLNQMLILVGPQDVGKTEWIEGLFAQSMKSYCLSKKLEFGSFRSDGVKLAMELANTLVCNCNEVDAMFTAKGSSELKEFLDQKKVRVVLPYGEAPVDIVRRTVFSGSTNKNYFLRDVTGNRRFLCIHAEKINLKHEIDLDQLWGQLYSIHMSGEKHWFDSKVKDDAEVISMRDKINSGMMSQGEDAVAEVLDALYDVEKARRERSWRRVQLSEIKKLVMSAAGANKDQRDFSHAAIKKSVQVWSTLVSGLSPVTSGTATVRTYYWMPPVKDFGVTQQEQIAELEEQIKQLKSTKE